MYATYFGMKESPFGLTPDPKFVFWSRTHHEALAHLLYGVQERKGFILLTGEVGVGKTLLCRCLVDALGEGVRTALIVNPLRTGEEFLRRVNQDFGFRTNPRKEPLDRLNAFLLAEYGKGHNCVLIIDESHALPAEVLEQIRLISNLETKKSKLIQIVLVGQNELNETLNLYSMRQLRQRIAVSFHLTGFDEAETAAYIHHRLGAASADPSVEFTSGAVRAVHACTGGNPREINILCDRALLAAYSSGVRRVGRKAVRAASRELVAKRIASLAKRRPGARAPGRWVKHLAWAFAACAGIVAGFMVGRIWGWP